MAKTKTMYTPAQRIEALDAFRQSGMTVQEFSANWGVGEATLKKWLSRYAKGGESAFETSGKRGRPKGSGKAVPEPMKVAVLSSKKDFPFFGVRRVQSWCERAFGLGVSRREVEKTLTEAGVEPVKRRKRRQMKRTIHRFERAKPMQMWQSDITQFVCPRTEKRVFLCVFLDDCSRYVAGWAVAARQTTEMVIAAYESGVLRYGRPAECLTDQGRQYAAWRGKTEFQAKLKQDGVKHTLSRPHHPETLGKCERLWETMREEFWQGVEVVDVEDAKERLTHWFGHYNHMRPHQGLENATPAERFFGTEDASRKAIEEAVAKNAAAIALGERPRQPFYMTARIGEEQVAISADRGGLVVSTGDGTKRIGFEDLGGTGAQDLPVESGPAMAAVERGPDSGPMPASAEMSACAEVSDAD